MDPSSEFIFFIKSIICSPVFESRLAVGSTILGGMIISTFFTLYVTPTMYLALAKNTKRIDAVDIELKKELR